MISYIFIPHFQKKIFEIYLSSLVALFIGMPLLAPTKYMHYGDEFSIYTKSKSKARKAGNEVYLFLKNKLKLPINPEKSGIRKPVQFKIL